MNNLTVELWDIDKLIPAPDNAKKHPDDQVKRLAASIEKNWVVPLHIEQDGTIIAGHGRRLACLLLGRKTIPVIVHYGISKDQARAMRIADNKTASNDYDVEILRKELFDLESAGVDISSLGFEDSELDKLMADMGEIDATDFVEDISIEVENQKEENLRKEAEVDASTSPISDALGFKRVTISQSRRLRELIGEFEDRTGYRGVDALIEALTIATT